MQKPSIPKGTRDFSPEEMAKRNYIFNTIRDVFHLYGFQQIETPAMENLSTLMGKYGEEGDKLLFKILNSGDCLAQFTDEELTARNPLRFAAKACEKGLRYDLTVPFARFVVQHRNAPLPIEVKSGTKGSMKSLRILMNEKSFKLGVRTSEENLGELDGGQIRIVPLYLIGEYESILRT